MKPGDDQATTGFAVPASLSAVAVRYEVHAEIGRGGMGIVYKARDRQTGDLVAIKVIHPSIASDPQLIERFRNELLLARRITHKNVCRVYDLNDFDGTTVISMELLEGRSLREMLRDVESVSIRQGLKIARQIAAGLAEAHARGVVHRDLKPENILIGRDGAAKIMDFGIARLMDSRITVTGQLVGTPAYMSPEQAEGKPTDARSDIYSLGLVLYEMFCGRPAFSGETPVALVAKHVGETPVAPREIEADLPMRIDEAIRRCLEKHPDKRFQSVVELDAALSAGPGTAPDVPEHDTAAPAEHLARWQKTDWALLAGAAIGLTVFFACFARVSLAPRSQVTFDRAVLRRIAEEHLQRLGVPPTPVRPVAGTLDPGAYVYLARKYGAAAAREFANNPVPYWTSSVAFQRGSLDVDNRGRLIAFSREAVPIDATARSFDEARQLAERTIEDVFGAAASALRLEHETKGQVYSFAWLGQEIVPGLRQRYSVDVDARGVSMARVSPDLPPGYSIESFPFGEVTMNEWGLPVAVVIGVVVCAFGFVNRRRVAQRAPWRTAMTIAGFIVGAGQTLASFRFFGVGDMLSVPAGFGVLFAGVAYLGSIGLEVLLRRNHLHKLSTFTALFDADRSKDASGLAVVRGCAVGIALVAIDTAAVWCAIAYFGGRLSMIHLGLLGGIINSSVWPVGLVWGIAVVQMVGVGLLVGLAHAVAARLPVRPWIGGVCAAGVLAASGIRLSMGTVEPWYLTAIVLFVDYALLVAVFRWFDLLTLCAAIGTFGLWWANYALFVMQQPIGAVGPWTVFVVWGLCVAGAAAVAFQSPLRRGYRRFAAAFD